jgi:uncharacterized protein YjlB
MTVETYFLRGDGAVPNSRLPALIYRDVIRGDVVSMEAQLRANEWPPEWHASFGMYPRHHFHSDAHELIAVTRGQMTCRLGGVNGVNAHMKAGDVVVIPAGVGHFGESISDDLRLTGAFPVGHAIHDFRLGDPAEYGRMVQRAQATPIPGMDPFFGATGPLIDLWTNAEKGRL